MKLFPKLALAVSLLLVGTTLALSVCFYIAERRFIRAQADLERRGLLQNLVHITQESLLTNDDLMLVKYVRWLPKGNPSLASASVANPQGQILAHSEPNQIGKPLRPPATGARAEVLVLTQPVRLGKRWVATASASFSERLFEETVEARLHDLQKRLGSIVTAAVAAGVGISFLLALSWTRPIGRLAEAAKHIGQGNYGCDLSAAVRRRDELGNLTKALQAMARQLQELDQMKEDFVSAVTHELRSPLGAIESYLNLIYEEIRDGNSAPAWSTYIDRMRANTQRLSRFVNDLLDVAALERGKITLEPGPLDLPPLLRDVVTFFSVKLAERQLTCVTNFPSSELPLAWADPEKIRQVLVYLLSNAIKFTPEHGTIELGAKKESGGDGIVIYVRDSGPGIAPENQFKIFNNFEQVQSARLNVKGPRGTGLGLSMARALVELHGSRLGLESKIGEGSCFYFTLQTKGALV